MSLDIEGVLSAHVRECFDEWCGECLCGWLVPEDADDFTAAHRAHVAAALREQIDGAVRVEREAFLSSPALDSAWIAGWHSATDHIAARLSDTEGPGMRNE